MKVIRPSAPVDSSFDSKTREKLLSLAILSEHKAAHLSTPRTPKNVSEQGALN